MQSWFSFRVFTPLMLAAAVAANHAVAAAGAEVIPLWPKGAPTENADLGPEKDMTKPTDNKVAGQRVIRLGNVTQPTMTVYRAPNANGNTPAVVVFPGGAYHILALDLEGTEVCDWLNSIGVTAVLLKYRVPRRAGLEKHAVALQDAQRAVGLVRYRAKDFGIDPQRIGVLGFSAGGHLAAAVSTSAPQRTYPVLDEADKTSCRPDFTVLIYPAYLTLKEENDKVAPDVAVSSNTPPTFITMTEDDPIRIETALYYALALKRAGVPFELHVYPKGGHGYGLRRTDNPVTAWPERATDWMRSRGLLATSGTPTK